MGTLRLLLALSVFLAHAQLVFIGQLVPPDTAVHAFYIISGFYMSMVLNGKYARGAKGYRDFLLSRVLRLMPAYLVMLAASVLVVVGIHAVVGESLPPLRAWSALQESGVSLAAGIALLLSHLSLLGLDLYHVLGWNASEGLLFIADFHRDPRTLHELLAVPQAWSLTVELYFYLLAPLLVRLPVRYLAGWIVASLGLRFAGWMLFDLRSDPWSYRCFPFELAFFLGGALAYRIGLLTPAGRASAARRALVLSVGCALGFVDWWAQAHDATPALSLVRIPFVAGVVALLPALFQLTKNWTADRLIGELSFPIYISHVLVIWTFDALAPASLSVSLRAAGLLFGVLASALLIHFLIDRRVDRWRHGHFARNDARSLAPCAEVAR